MQTFYSGIQEEEANSTIKQELLYKEEDVSEDEEETMEEEDEEDLDTEMEGIVSDTDDKTGIVKDDMLAMVNIGVLRWCDKSQKRLLLRIYRSLTIKYKEW